MIQNDVGMTKMFDVSMANMFDVGMTRMFDVSMANMFDGGGGGGLRRG